MPSGISAAGSLPSSIWSRSSAFDAALDNRRTRLFRMSTRKLPGQADERGERCPCGAALLLLHLADDFLSAPPTHSRCSSPSARGAWANTPWRSSSAAESRGRCRRKRRSMLSSGLASDTGLVDVGFFVRGKVVDTQVKQFRPSTRSDSQLLFRVAFTYHSSSCPLLCGEGGRNHAREAADRGPAAGGRIPYPDEGDRVSLFMTVTASSSQRLQKKPSVNSTDGADCGQSL